MQVPVSGIDAVIQHFMQPQNWDPMMLARFIPLDHPLRSVVFPFGWLGFGG